MLPPGVKNNLADAAKKNPPDCALSAEADIYACNARLLELAGEGPFKSLSSSFPLVLAAFAPPIEMGNVIVAKISERLSSHCLG